LKQNLRPATAADLPAILKLLAEDAIRYVDEPAGVTERQCAAIAEIIADPNALLLVGEIDGRVVSTATVNYLRILTMNGGLICQIEAVRTAADVRGQGLGQQLIAHIIDRATERGCTRVQLTSNKQRTRARAFYERLGFQASHVGFKLMLPATRPASI
jgi:GNAT superfamily N-acetyltransferase